MSTEKRSQKKPQCLAPSCLRPLTHPDQKSQRETERTARKGLIWTRPVLLARSFTDYREMSLSCYRLPSALCCFQRRQRAIFCSSKTQNAVGGAHIEAGLTALTEEETRATWVGIPELESRLAQTRGQARNPDSLLL